MFPASSVSRAQVAQGSSLSAWRMSRVATNYEFINASALPEPINLPLLVAGLAQTVAGGIRAVVQRCCDCCTMGAAKPEAASPERRRASFDAQSLMESLGRGSRGESMRKYSSSLNLLGATMGEKSKRQKEQNVPKGVPEEFRARDAYLQLLSSGRQRTANDQAAGERINLLQWTLTQLSTAQVHDRKLLLEVREMVLDLKHQGGGTVRRAASRAEHDAPATRAVALQEEVLTLASTLETKLDEFKGCVATLQQMPARITPQLLPLGTQAYADYHADPLGC